MDDSTHDPRKDSGPPAPPDCSAVEQELAAQKDKYLRLAVFPTKGYQKGVGDD